eukprot:TRINITY_DN9921_c0_g1_i1.p1 TRINITY_DN9921_c0_g1~~TRINITY_DN9921_c0_g1_i1.p1  ORF type:complete len:269 (-),score=40.69 TRINITY_DN9921_c0_g1_i1:659-1465(-)
MAENLEAILARHDNLVVRLTGKPSKATFVISSIASLSETVVMLGEVDVLSDIFYIRHVDTKPGEPPLLCMAPLTEENAQGPPSELGQSIRGKVSPAMCVLGTDANSRTRATDAPLDVFCDGSLFGKLRKHQRLFERDGSSMHLVVRENIGAEKAAVSVACCCVPSCLAVLGGGWAPPAHKSGERISVLSTTGKSLGTPLIWQKLPGQRSWMMIKMRGWCLQRRKGLFVLALSEAQQRFKAVSIKPWCSWSSLQANLQRTHVPVSVCQQ